MLVCKVCKVCELATMRVSAAHREVVLVCVGVRNGTRFQYKNPHTITRKPCSDAIFPQMAA